MLTWHDILTYVRLFLRWWFVLALAVGLSAGTAWYISSQQPDVYAAQATLRVGNNFEVAAPNQAQVALSNVLADYYVALAKREVILGPVVERLQLSFPWWVIRDNMLAVRVDKGTNLIEITVNDTEPERGAAIANAIGEQLITYTPNASDQAVAQQAELNRQLEETQANIQAVEAKIVELEAQLSSLSSAIDISDVQSQLEALQLTRQSYVTEYSSLLSLRNEASANSLGFFEQARPAVTPLPKKRSLTLAMAGAGGLLMAIVAVLVLDRLDERWRTGADLQSRTGIRSLGDVPGGIAAGPGVRPTGARRQEALSNTYSNMVLAAKSKLPRTLLISSPHSGVARSAMAIDIAEMYTSTGHRVLLVEMESAAPGIAELLGQASYERPVAGRSGAAFDGPGSLWDHVRPTPIHNLLVLSGREAGYTRFSSLVPLIYWPEMLAHLCKSADIVIFDGPSALIGPDASLLAPLVEGVMLVLNGRQDSRSTAIKARKQLISESATNFLGAIVTSDVGRVRQKAIDSSRRGGFQISFGRKGITITIGEPPLPQPGSNGAHSPVQTLLSLPECSDEASPAADAAGEPEHMTWDDLLELDPGTSAARQKHTPGMAPPARSSDTDPGCAASPASSEAPPGRAGARSIITPPPAGARPFGGGQDGAKQSAAPPAGRWPPTHCP